MVNFNSTTLSNGKTVVLPMPSENEIPMGLYRKTRHLKGEAQEQELFMLINEYFLSEENLDVLDSMTAGDWEEYGELNEDNVDGDPKKS